ncbi:UNVERIFIED_CONTAM: hypothetical protein K2H54_018948 [Gekko kuhli]
MGPAVLQLLSVACLAFTLGMFGTGLSDLRQMFATQSVENIQFLPFLTTDVNNLSWLSYGFLKGDWTLIIVNAIGAALQTLYILVYFYFSPEKGKPVRLKGGPRKRILPCTCRIRREACGNMCSTPVRSSPVSGGRTEACRDTCFPARTCRRNESRQVP